MRKRLIASIVALTASLASVASAEDKPADACQIFVKRIGAGPSSHGSGSIVAVIKVGWIGGGEQIQRVGFYGYTETRDLGNAPGCGTIDPRQDWRIVDATPGGYYASEYGEYSMSFRVRSGSVVSECPGLHYTHVGTFFVQTDRNTYWVNPQMDPTQYFYFDVNGFDILQRQVGSWNITSTARPDLSYYNPLQCR